MSDTHTEQPSDPPHKPEDAQQRPSFSGDYADPSFYNNPLVVSARNHDESSSSDTPPRGSSRKKSRETSHRKSGRPSFFEAIKQLPVQYLKVVSKPSVWTFTWEMRNASWSIVWVQLIAYGIIIALINFLGTQAYLKGFFLGEPDLPSLGMEWISTLIFSANATLLMPLFFFLNVGIEYLIARLCGGTGRFLQQCYTGVLITIPINLLLAMIAAFFSWYRPSAESLIAFVDIVIPLLGWFYSVVLTIFSIMAVHRLSGYTSIWVVIIAYIVSGFLMSVVAMYIFFNIMIFFIR